MCTLSAVDALRDAGQEKTGGGADRAARRLQFVYGNFGRTSARRASSQANGRVYAGANMSGDLLTLLTGRRT